MTLDRFKDDFKKGNILKLEHTWEPFSFPVQLVGLHGGSMLGDHGDGPVFYEVNFQEHSFCLENTWGEQERISFPVLFVLSPLAEQVYRSRYYQVLERPWQDQLGKVARGPSSEIDNWSFNLASNFKSLKTLILELCKI